ncbi:hypothetical protein EVAR_17776_1 [Eumeta japonica]|uniref:Uncharacterized protein n=1 Tax=Eumeta variegata TaxID=151549 RepID=A0A4C1TTG6_EUMVA|nr:hypothetical protein EVAR_17776_1 [Eumeta japonica]
MGSYGTYTYTAVKVGYDRREMKVESMQWRYDVWVRYVLPSGRTPARTCGAITDNRKPKGGAPGPAECCPEIDIAIFVPHVAEAKIPPYNTKSSRQETGAPQSALQPMTRRSAARVGECATSGVLGKWK